MTYYVGRDLTDVVEKLSDPLDLQALEGDADSSAGQALVVKEMPYQVGRRFPLLVALADSPIIFLMRDPRLNIASRMAKKREVGDSPVFPFVETGWELLSRQITWCREHGVPHLLVDSTDFRNRPREVFPQVFEQLGLEFDDGMLQWRARPEVELDNLGGLHRHLYDVALGSTGIRSETASIPPLEAFPRDGGWREHVERCLAIYRELGGLEARLSAEPRTTC